MSGTPGIGKTMTIADTDKDLRAQQDRVIQAAFDHWRKTEYPYAHPVQDLPAFHAGYLAALTAAGAAPSELTPEMVANISECTRNCDCVGECKAGLEK